MHDRAKVPPVCPISPDVFRGRARDTVQPVGDVRQRGGLYLDPVLDLLLLVTGLQCPADLVQQKSEGVKERGRERSGHISVGDPREESTDLDLERSLLVGLAKQRVEDPLAAMYATRRQSIRPAWIERLYREGDLPVGAADDQADFRKPVRPLYRIEEWSNGGFDAARLAVADRELSDLGVELGQSLAIVLAQHVLERLAQ